MAQFICSRAQLFKASCIFLFIGLESNCNMDGAWEFVATCDGVWNESRHASFSYREWASFYILGLQPV